jgi:hypothetical protein
VAFVASAGRCFRQKSFLVKRKPPLLRESRPREETFAPFGPTEKLAPRFERFMFTPGATFFVLRKNSPIA